MRRSRSSFDLTGALEKAAALTPAPSAATADKPRPFYEGVALVSFSQSVGEPAPAHAPPVASAPAPAHAPTEPAAPTELDVASTPMPPTPPSPTEMAETEATLPARRLPLPPDLSDIAAVGARCQRVIEWIVEATSARDVFISDEHGLSVAGTLRDGDKRLAAAGGVYASMRRLASAAPGNVAATFTAELGDSPVLSILSFEAAGGEFLLGLVASDPLSSEHARVVRAACKHALEPPTSDR